MSGNVASVIVMGVNMVTAIIALPLLNYFGRRTLMIITLGLASIFLALEGLFNTKGDGTMSLIMCLLFIAVFEFGPGPIAWIYMSEVMNEKGVAMGTFLNWFFTLVFAIFTPFFVYRYP
jgi:MFS family permease